jgi:hypothetical protein
MRKTIAALIGAAATVTMISGAGLATASASTHPASTRPAVTRTEHFQDVSASLTSNKSHVLGYGAFNAGGTDVQKNNNTDIFKFPGGSFRVTHKVKGGHQSFSKAACVGKVSQHGTYKLSKGRGKFAGISGSGHFTVSVLLVAGRNSLGACSKKPVAVQVIIRAHGPVTLS